MNLYGFVSNDPLRKWDYLGRRENDTAEVLCKCKETLKALRESEPFKTKLDELKKDKCLGKDPECGTCEIPSSLGQYAREHVSGDTTMGVITICSVDDIPACRTRTRMEQTLRHEMQHARDICNKPVCLDSDTQRTCCARHLYTEVKAHFCALKHPWRSISEIAEWTWSTVSASECRIGVYMRDAIQRMIELYGGGMLTESDCYMSFPADPPTVTAH